MLYNKYCHGRIKTKEGRRVASKLHLFSLGILYSLSPFNIMHNLTMDAGISHERINIIVSNVGDYIILQFETTKRTF